MIFLDASAIHALADAKDPDHACAKARFGQALQADEQILTHDYVLADSMALLQRRLGIETAIRLTGDSKAFEAEWVDDGLHDEAVAHLERTGKRGVRLADMVSFLVMQRRGVRHALAFDPDFAAEGFHVYGAD
jgi:predicted nucleic acid-binding protein